MCWHLLEMLKIKNRRNYFRLVIDVFVTNEGKGRTVFLIFEITG